MKTIGLRPLALALVGAVLLPAAASAHPPPGKTSWQRLRFVASKFLLKASTEVRLATVSGSTLHRALIDCPDHRALRPGTSAALLSLDTDFLGREEEVEVWFEPKNGTAYQRRKVRGGKKAYSKIYRFAEDGVFSRRASPEEPRGGGAPETWPTDAETFYNYRGDCARVSEPSVLFHLVSTADLDGGPLALCTFSDKALQRIEIKNEGLVDLDVDYLERARGGEVRRQGTIRAIKLFLHAEPAPGETEYDFELLGLEGDVELYLTQDTRIPVQVSGRVPKLGRINVRLDEVDLR